MFDGVPDQFHQLIAPRTSLPLHLPFPLHASSAATFPPPFDPYNNPPHHLPPLQSTAHLLHPLHHQSPTHEDEDKEENNGAVSMNFKINIERERQQPPDELINDSWTNDEVLALLRIRSSMETWFPELTWEHVSRKLAELGFKRSADKCKEKFEEESRYFNNINYGKNYRFLGELEELYPGDHHHQNQDQFGAEKSSEKMEEDSRNDASVTKQYCEEESERVVEIRSNKECSRKRKRHDKFEMFKGFCENIVKKMMAQQEETHNRLLEDMLKRDEEKFAREEAWKKQEMDRMNKELEMMAQEQAIAGDRQATIIEFLKKFAASSPANHSFGSGNGKDKLTVTNGSNPNLNTRTSAFLLHAQNHNHNIGENNGPPPSSTMALDHQSAGPSPAHNIGPALPITEMENPSSSLAQDSLFEVPSSSTSVSAPQNPNSLNSSQNNPLPASSVSTYKASSSSNLVPTHEKEDVGRRWPRDEVLALINIRCSLNNNNSEDREGNKVPLWERISQGMLELGYKRSAKRCKEKWENINKYFRKTKDVNKKRSLDSRTCPYFHQLSTLYSQGKLVPQSETPENHLSSPPENNRQVPPEAQVADSSQVGSSHFSMNVDGGEKTLMQVPALDFDQF